MIMNKINIVLFFCTIYIIFFKIEIHYYFCFFFFLCISKTCCWTRYGQFQVSKPVSPPLDLRSFCEQHIPVLGTQRSVVCWKRERKQFKVQTYCEAPQCKNFQLYFSYTFVLFHLLCNLCTPCHFNLIC